jgi:hypothetical protein
LQQNHSYLEERHSFLPLKQNIDIKIMFFFRISIHSPFLYEAPAALRTSPRFFNT